MVILFSILLNLMIFVNVKNVICGVIKKFFMVFFFVYINFYIDLFVKEIFIFFGIIKVMFVCNVSVLFV